MLSFFPAIFVKIPIFVPFCPRVVTFYHFSVCLRVFSVCLDVFDEKIASNPNKTQFDWGVARLPLRVPRLFTTTKVISKKEKKS